MPWIMVIIMNYIYEDDRVFRTPSEDIQFFREVAESFGCSEENGTLLLIENATHEAFRDIANTLEALPMDLDLHMLVYYSGRGCDGQMISVDAKTPFLIEKLFPRASKRIVILGNYIIFITMYHNPNASRIKSTFKNVITIS